ncbi:hypothetical protein ABNB56_07170 [Streptococcus iniae]|uniref:hypothetical protein n=1 Tax=Streptococcus iniae TaxID=1346 RepID=UPI000EFA79CD|nr:hypothetical protein [Streptococcus iniae]RMI79769.1 hypothetical protein DIX58_00810 [Streptococcus iniae]
MFKLFFEINGETKFQNEHKTKDAAMDAVRLLIKDKSSLPIRDSWGIHTRGNRTIIDYGAHNAKYIIEEDVKL